MNKKSKKRVLLAISGSVAAYKACEVASALTQKGIAVSVAMTRHAAELISPILFRALTGQPAVVDEFKPDSPAPMTHIDFADCDLFLIAPASAGLIGRLASGLADDLVTTAALAIDPETPKLLAPAMNSKMYSHPIVQKNLVTLQEIGYQLIEPEEGFLACGVEGVGRLADPRTIVTRVVEILGL